MRMRSNTLLYSKGDTVKIVALLFALVLVSSCSEKQIEELTFRKTLEYDLIELCEKDEKCINSVKSQIKDCMVKSDWRKYLEDQDSQNELKRFTKEFYSCVIDEEGNPYFESSL